MNKIRKDLNRDMVEMDEKEQKLRNGKERLWKNQEKKQEREQIELREGEEKKKKREREIEKE